ncbi:hypothetical protein Defa_10610 [Desulfovibrio sp. TH_2024_36128]|uniref:Uncharacterized protein n=1 Tax=Desulfovibrio falkowii TaxID=3136602 RepID=A0ABQ0E791_9BACT
MQRQAAASQADKKDRPGNGTAAIASTANDKGSIFPVRRLENYSVKNDDISKEQFSLPGGSP